MPNERFEPVSFEVDEVVKETEAAFLCSIEGEELWIPKSQLKDGSDELEEGGSGTIVIPTWLAEEKGLV